MNVTASNLARECYEYVSPKFDNSTAAKNARRRYVRCHMRLAEIALRRFMTDRFAR